MIVTFLSGYRKGKYSRTEKGVEAFYADFDAVELSLINNETGGTDIEHYTDKNPLKWRQFVRLVRLFEKSGRTPNSLVKNYRGSSLHEPKFTSEAERFVEDFIVLHADQRRPSVKQLLDDIETANNKRPDVGLKKLDLPSKRTIQRRIAAMNALRKDAGRRGEDSARLAYQMSFEGPIVTRPLQRVEMDEKLYDLVVLMQDVGIWDLLHEDAKEMVLKMRRRVWLSVAFDYASRSVLALRLLKGSPNSRSAVETLQMAVQGKEHITRAVKTISPWPQCGRPEWVYTDSGPAWKSNDFQDAVYAVTGNHCKPPARNPTLRGAIERFFRTSSPRARATTP
jgi:putative transposase